MKLATNDVTLVQRWCGRTRWLGKRRYSSRIGYESMITHMVVEKEEHPLVELSTTGKPAA
jgi:hypothetical protein